MEIKYFDVMKSIISKQPIPDNSINTHFNGWQAVTWLSNNPMACYTANMINTARGNKFIPKIAEYTFLKKAIKLPKNTFLKDNKNDKDLKIIETVISNYYSIGMVTARDYMKILGGDKIIEIIEKYLRVNTKADKIGGVKINDMRTALAKKKAELLKMKGTE